MADSVRSTDASCPDEGALAAFVDGSLDADAQQGVEEHLRGCESCRAVATLGAASAGGSTDRFVRALGIDDANRRRAWAEAQRGTSVGRYDLRAVAGMGAMGTVFEARDAQLRRTVAVKILALAIGDNVATAELLRREASTLAQASHPAVVEIYDAGIADGRVYIVMEFVRGTTLRSWLGRGRSVADVTSVFVQAAEGLAAAHAAGVVHGDFKPDNVMVSSDGRARILDFGLARWLDRTESGRAGTPAYMAPETVEDGHASEASDQYAFAVSMVEALCGHRPRVGDDAIDWSAPVPAPLRETIERALSRLDEQRWPSMATLAAQLRRGSPRRSRGRWVAAALGIAAAAGGLYAFAPGRSERCTAGLERSGWRVEDRGAVAEAFATNQAEYAEQALRTTTTRLDAYDTEFRYFVRELCRAPGDDSDPLAFDRTVSCLATQRAYVSTFVAALREADDEMIKRAVGRVQRLPRPGACREATQDAIDNPENQEAAEQLRAEINEVVALETAGRAEIGHQRALDLLGRAEALGEPSVLARAKVRAGLLAGEFGDPDSGVRWLTEAYESALERREDHLAAEAANALLYEFGNRQHAPEPAERWVRHAESAANRVGEPDISEEFHRYAGNYYAGVGRHQVGLVHKKKAWRLLVTFEREDTYRAAQLLGSLGNSYVFTGDLEQAREHLHRAGELKRRMLGADHPDLSGTFTSLGLLEKMAGRPHVAEQHFRRSLELELLEGENDRLRVALGESNLGNMLLELTEYDEAVEHLRRAEAIFTRVYGPDSPRMIATLLGLSWCEAGRRKFEAARELAARAETIVRDSVGVEGPHYMAVLQVQGDIFVKLGELERAEPLLTRSCELHIAAVGADHPDTARCHEAMGRLWLAKGHGSAARSAFADALALAPASDEQSRGTAHHGLARAYRQLGDHAAAVEHLEQALAAFINADADAASLGLARFDLAKELWRTPAQRPRALQLGLRSQADFASLHYPPPEATKLEAWLSADL